MRTITFLIALILCTAVCAQPQRRGLVIKKFPSAQPVPPNPSGFITKLPPHAVGDTLPILGIATTHPRWGKVFLYQDGPVQAFVEKERIQLLDGELPFWEEAWFAHRESMDLKGKWPLATLATLDQGATAYISELYEGSLIVEEESLNDYLLQMLLRIYPDTLIKSRPCHLHVWVVQSLYPVIFSLDNGAVLLSTGLLTRIQSEWELENALARQVAHILLDHQLANALEQQKPFYTDPSTATNPTREYLSYSKKDNLIRWEDFPWPNPSLRKRLGAYFSEQQKDRARTLARDYMTRTYPEGKPATTTADSHRFILLRSTAFMRNAWKQYDLRRYDAAATLTDSLLATGAATGEAYLLRAKIQRMQYASPAHNRQALAWLKTAREKDVSGLPEIEREMALLWLRLDDKDTAKLLLEQYIARLQATATEKGESATDITWAREMILKCDRL